MAALVAEHLQLPYFPSDHFYWERNWVRSTPECLRAHLSRVVEQEAWVLDGNFDEFREWVWPMADGVVWLDYSFATVLWRVAGRNLRWFRTREETWSGNRMGLGRALSGIRHTIMSHPRKSRNYPGWLAEHFRGRMLRFRTPAEADGWLTQLSSIGE
jgi:hypothetical protein